MSISRYIVVAVVARHPRADSTAPTVVVQPFGKAFGLAETLDRPRKFTQQVQYRPQVMRE
jgi:hypothetical protein